ncbi:hypothetical protein [Salsuginibacillus kocurii]|uniref:hypothetical protein n=1 Tax=Salsuginibacillus kocurii TaxID=427078 RepID=UPI00037E0C23|nr:hypothetical protein [Salsuginibacillus kocurii]
MNWVQAAGITLIVVLVVLYERTQLLPDQKKEKITLGVLSFLGWSLAVLLVFFPQVPGPNEVVEMIFKPLTQLLEE